MMSLRPPGEKLKASRWREGGTSYLYSVMHNSNHYDAIVIGVGSMGSAACLYLAQRGCRVLGLEQFDIVHENGSHSGQSRIIRKAYFEHPDYVPLLQKAYDNWAALERETGSQLYHRTGVVYFGDGDSATIKGIARSASMHKIPLMRMNAGDSRKYFPAFRIPESFDTLFEADAGFVTPERAIRLYARQAESRGAVIHAKEKVLAWDDAGSHIVVNTAAGSYQCDKLVITAGSWTSKLVPQLNTELKVTRQTLAWINPKRPELMSLGNLPCWFIDDRDRGIFYGFPILPFENFGGPIGMKLACHKPGPVTDPDQAERTPGEADLENISYALEKYFPDAGDEIITTKTCFYTYSEDENFIIDHLPGYDKRVSIACGFSGHGFKFVSVVGEVLADLVMKGRTDLPVGFLSAKRFLPASGTGRLGRGPD